jgi:hypothetical protein
MKTLIFTLSLLIVCSCEKIAVDNNTDPDKYDRNNDNKIDEIVYYNKDGYTQKVETDNNWDGVFDEFNYYDDEGNIVRLELDENFDGKIESITEYKLGQLVSSKDDVDFNGIYDIYSTYEFDVLKKSEIRPNDSKHPIKITEYSSTHFIEYADKDEDGKMDTYTKFDNFERIIEQKNL